MEARTQQFHRNLAIFVLRTFILTLHDNAGRLVRNPNGRIGDVDMLSSRAAGAIAINAKFILVDIHLHRVVNFRRNVNCGEGGMPAVVKVIRRQPDEPMDSRFGLQIAVGISACDENSCTLNAPFIVGGYIHNFSFVAASVTPSEIHPHQHFRPILRVYAACTGVYAENGVVFIKLAGEH